MIKAAIIDPRASRRHSAFTLVELLVVISIIALLIAILLPSLSKARDQAKDVKCKANLHQIGIAFTMYGEKFDGKWPAAVDTLGNQNRWPVPFFDGRIITDELAQFNAAGQVIKGGGDTVFLCPAEKAERGIPNWRGTGTTVDRVEVGGSYSYNEEIHRDGSLLDRGKGPPNPVPPFMRRIEQCRRPGTVIGLTDNYEPIKDVTDQGWRFNRGDFFLGYRTFSGAVAAPTAWRFRRFGDRHSGRCNGMSLDTHVESYFPEKIGYNQVSWEPWDTDPKNVPGGEL